MHVDDFSNYNHFIIFNFVLMINISMTIKKYVKSCVNIVRLDVRLDHLDHEWILFCQTIPCTDIAVETPPMSS